MRILNNLLMNALLFIRFAIRDSFALSLRRGINVGCSKSSDD
jgi:hypothetical protein